jgi:hypothetical protein
MPMDVLANVLHPTSGQAGGRRVELHTQRRLRADALCFLATLAHALADVEVEDVGAVFAADLFDEEEDRSVSVLGRRKRKADKRTVHTFSNISAAYMSSDIPSASRSASPTLLLAAIHTDLDEREAKIW